jgi:DegV family protein with EDD domain
MVDYLSNYKGKSSTSCPNCEDWLDAFGDAENIFCVTITSNLSGSYNAAMLAKDTYETEHPDRKVYVFDSLSAGPELRLIVEKLAELINEYGDFEKVCETICEYTKSTGLLFMLESMKNLANNGRVSPIVAKAAGLLGIRIVGKASDVGTLEVMEKCRGEKKALPAIVQKMREIGYKDGKVIIDHCFNPDAAQKLKELILENFQNAKIIIGKCRGLCSFYAEKGGLLIGFEH